MSDPLATPGEQPVCSKMVIGRLYNLGNYEHIRYELTLEVLPGSSPKDVLHAGLKVLQGVAPIKDSTIGASKAILAKRSGDLTNWEAEHLDETRKRVEHFDYLNKKRYAALELFASMGGIDAFTDAKQKWEDDGFSFEEDER